jgi:hypothetical protein
VVLVADFLPLIEASVLVEAVEPELFLAAETEVELALEPCDADDFFCTIYPSFGLLSLMNAWAMPSKMKRPV